MNNTQIVYTVVGAIGIYLAHGIENKKQNPDEPIWFNIDHINRVALYWSLGAIGYWLIINRIGYIPGE